MNSRQLPDSLIGRARAELSKYRWMRDIELQRLLIDIAGSKEGGANLRSELKKAGRIDSIVAILEPQTEGEL